MKKSLFCLLISILSISTIYSQNLLPLVWKISFTDTTKTDLPKKNINQWKSVDLLLSWERQGYFWQDGKGCMAVDFKIPNEFKDSAFIFTMHLECRVHDVFINGKSFPLTSFYGGANNAKSIKISKETLHVGGSNRIELFVSDMAWTGGISHNYCTLTPLSNAQKSDVKITVPSADHVFNSNDASLAIHYKTPSKGTLNLCIKTDFHDTVFTKSYPAKPNDSLLVIDLKKILVKPGLYESIVVLKDMGYTGDVEWIAVKPEQIACTTDAVAGYKDYWDQALEELEKVKPDFKMRRVDSLSTDTRDGYEIEMKSLGNLTIKGFYFVPRTSGKHAVLIHMPGYGQRFDNLDHFIKNTENVAELAICIRGHEIGRTGIFDPPNGPCIWGYKLCNEQEYSYRGIYMDCVRGVDFLLSRPEIDSTRIGVLGGSQGGGLSLATSGLCKNKIAACAYWDPWPCDIRDHVRIRTLIKTEYLTFLKYYNNGCTMDQVMHVADLMNTKGFAHWITCPVFYSTSLFDDDCPPHVGFAAYNLVKTPKEYKVQPFGSHGEGTDNSCFGIFFKKQFKY